MEEIDEAVGGAVERAEKAFGDLSNLGPELYANRLGALPNSDLANEILRDFEGEFEGDFAQYMEEAGVKDSDSALLKVYKLHEHEKVLKDKKKSKKS